MSRNPATPTKIVIFGLLSLGFGVLAVGAFAPISDDLREKLMVPSIGAIIGGLTGCLNMAAHTTSQPLESRRTIEDTDKDNP